MSFLINYCTKSDLRWEEYRERDGCILEYICHTFVAQNTSASKYFTKNSTVKLPTKLMNEKGR